MVFAWMHTYRKSVPALPSAVLAHGPAVHKARPSVGHGLQPTSLFLTHAHARASSFGGLLSNNEGANQCSLVQKQMWRKVGELKRRNE